MALLSGVSVQMKVSVPCLALGTVLFLVAFAVPDWVSGTSVDKYDFNGGLWRICVASNDPLVCFSSTDDLAKKLKWKRDWFVGPQVAACLALISLCVVLGSVVTFFIFKIKHAFVAIIVSTFVSGVLMLTGSAVYASKFSDDDFYSNHAHLSWGFAFSIIASLLTLAAAVGFVWYGVSAKKA